MHGADLAVKIGGKALKQRISLNQYPPKALYGVGVIARMNCVLITANGIYALHRHGIDANLDRQIFEGTLVLPIKIAHGLRLKLQSSRRAGAAAKVKKM